MMLVLVYPETFHFLTPPPPPPPHTHEIFFIYTPKASYSNPTPHCWVTDLDYGGEYPSQKYTADELISLKQLLARVTLLTD